MIKITLKDGTILEKEQGTSAFDIAKGISEGLARVAVACEINGEVCDLSTAIDADATLNILTFNDDAGKKVYWHTASHVLAYAVKKLFPEAKLAIGPAIDNGFYYDFDNETAFSEADLEKITAEMKKIVKENAILEKFVLPRDEAIKYMEDASEPYKVELIQDLPEGEIISFYKMGDFVDLCAGPHIPKTGMLKAMKLLSSTGAYWRGDSNRKMLKRIYAIAFTKNADLTEYIERLEEAKKRDHRKIGRELELFTIMEEGPGFPFFLPKGMILRNELINYWREIHTKAGYQEISTPIILNRSLWETSGHWHHYKENMYTTQIDEQDFAIKPMNCPGGMLTYKTKMRSYRDLPIRMGELGLVHRHELSGALHGLMRVRNFTQDDAHIFMTKDQIKDEIKGVVTLIDQVYKTFGFSYHIELSTQPEDSMGAKEDWDIATEALRQAIVELGYDYKLNEGDGAFYGPKLDFHLTDCIGRTWQCGTIQLDFQLPERFELEYTGADGEKHRPIMIHRVVFGSIERFIGILTEHFAGNFPTWLAPVQAKILPIGERQHEYAQAVFEKLQNAGIRVDIDLRNEKIGYKIREAQLEKNPYMLVLGDKEIEANAVGVRCHAEGDLGQMPVDEFISKITAEIAKKSK
ncbi:MAG: threonine--tRNA ligase [Clostridia bacterium]